MTNQSPWPAIELVFPVPPPTEAWEIFTAHLTVSLGCQGVTDLVFSPREATETPRHAMLYFPPEEGSPAEVLTAVDALLAELLPGVAVTTKSHSIALEDWGRTWRKYFRTIRIGERLYVGPPAEGVVSEEAPAEQMRAEARSWARAATMNLPADAPADAQLVLIYPGQAFGTGSHETTKLCLRVLEEVPLAGVNLLDIGTGSGILAFAAIRLGATSAIGVEYDPVCEENFLLNAELNNMGDRVCFILSASPERGLEGGVQKGFPPPDLVVCNTLSEQFTPLLPALRRIGKPLVLSGFLIAEAEVVRYSLKEAGFAVTRAWELDEWGAFTCEPVAR